HAVPAAWLLYFYISLFRLIINKCSCWLEWNANISAIFSIELFYGFSGTIVGGVGGTKSLTKVFFGYPITAGIPISFKHLIISRLIVRLRASLKFFKKNRILKRSFWYLCTLCT